MSNAPYDFVFVGAGCAGLSLASHLVEQGLGGRRMLLLDPRVSYQADRTWCSFGTEEHLFSSCVSKEWRTWRVRGAGKDVWAYPRDVAYQHVDSGAYYEKAQRILANDSHVELALGHNVIGIAEHASHVDVVTDHGTFEARVVLDSRPKNPLPRRGHPYLWQHFGGYFVRTERATFDPEVATLMDFDVDQKKGIHFVYVLPFDSRHALIEPTWFTKEVFEPSEYRRAFENYIRRAHPGVSFDVERFETGAIPMTTAELPVRSSKRHYQIGLAGGAAKPSTGYAFGFIQRFSRRFAVDLLREDLPEPPKMHTARAAFLDRVFLSYLKNYPGRAPGLFADLFEKAPPESIARFLSETSSPFDEMRVMSAMPKRAFMKESIRSHLPLA